MPVMCTVPVHVFYYRACMPVMCTVPVHVFYYRACVHALREYMSIIYCSTEPTGPPFMVSILSPYVGVRPVLHYRTH
jgi:hypothetical protein